jgi:hypothetical protein
MRFIYFRMGPEKHEMIERGGELALGGEMSQGRLKTSTYHLWF